jgi:chemotaxis protein methyltransferase CheR
MKADEIDFVAELARVRAGLMIDRAKPYVVETRLGPVARREGFGSIREMLLACRQRRDERLIWMVVESLAAGETFFYRDKQAFARLGAEILPEMMRHRGDRPIKIWSAGCSTGQEPYSLAMQIEASREDLPPGRVEILGTDLSERSLHKAQEGLYNQFEVQRGLPISSLLRHFERQDEMWRVSPRIRAMARWRRVNLNADFRALGQFDVIFCRNVLEEMEPQAARRALERLSLSLEPGGYLVLSQDEVAADAVTALEPAGGGMFRTDPRKAAA